jgi:hypothetical protein
MKFEIRFGQFVFNTLNSFPEFSKSINTLRGSFYDCFYNDEKVDGFLNQLRELHPKDENQRLYYYLLEYLKDKNFLYFLYDIVNVASPTLSLDLPDISSSPRTLKFTWDYIKFSAEFYDFENNYLYPLAESQTLQIESFIKSLCDEYRVAVLC